MTKRIPVCKNMTGNRGQDAEEESSASEGETETVGKPTVRALAQPNYFLFCLHFAYIDSLVVCPN